jgi:hypothetical protein
VLKQYRFRPQVRLAGGADTFQDHRDKFAQLSVDLSEQYPGLAIVLTSVEEAPQKRVTLHYTIDGTAFQMEQGRSLTNDTMNATLLQQIEAHLCQTGTHPITLDKISGETMARVKCAEGDFAILEPGAPVRHANKDPLDPIEWEAAS